MPGIENWWDILISFHVTIRRFVYVPVPYAIDALYIIDTRDAASAGLMNYAHSPATQRYLILMIALYHDRGKLINIFYRQKC